MSSEALEVSAAAITQKVTATSGVASFLGFAGKVDLIAWGGLAIAAVGLLIQLYFAIIKNKREKVEHEMRVAEYELRKEKLMEQCNNE